MNERTRETKYDICRLGTRRGNNLLLDAFQAIAGIIVKGNGYSLVQHLNIDFLIEHLHGMEQDRGIGLNGLQAWVRTCRQIEKVGRPILVNKTNNVTKLQASAVHLSLKLAASVSRSGQ